MATLLPTPTTAELALTGEMPLPTPSTAHLFFGTHLVTHTESAMVQLMKMNVGKQSLTDHA